MLVMGHWSGRADKKHLMGLPWAGSGLAEKFVYLIGRAGQGRELVICDGPGRVVKKGNGAGRAAAQSLNV